MATDNMYGIDISYRVEMRDSGAHPTIVTKTKVGEISVCSNPARIGIKDWTCIKDKLGQPGFLRLLPSSLTDRLFAQLVAAWSEVHVDGTLDKNAPSLPLGVLLRGLGNELRSKDISSTAANRRERAIEALLQYEGSAPWDLVTPDHCQSQLWFSAAPSSKRAECAAVMHRLYTALAFRGVFNPDPWIGFSSSLQPKEPSIESLQRRYLYQKFLNHMEIRQVLENCLAIKDSVSVAILLILILKLTIEEVCALSFGDLVRLKFFDVHALIVTEAYQRVNQNYRIKAIREEDAVILPVPTIVANIIKCLEENAKSNNNAKVKGNIYALPIVSQSSNRCARMKPSALTKAINERLRYIDVPRGQSLIGLLQRTAANFADECGFDADQIRYFLRYRANSTAAKHYASFISEDALLGMVQMMDQHLAELLIDESDACCEVKLEERGTTKIYSCRVQDKSYTSVKAKFRIKKEDVEGLLALQLFSASGFSAKIKIKELEGKNEHAN